MTVMGLPPLLYVGTAVSETADLMLSTSASSGCQLTVVFVATELSPSSVSEMRGIGDNLSALLKEGWSSGSDSVVSFVEDDWKGISVSDLESLVAMMNFKKDCASSKEDM